jgi:hypothetical protein
MITDYYRRIDEIQALRDKIHPTMPLMEGRAIEIEVFNKTIRFLFDVIEDVHFLGSVLALEKKVGIDNSEDPESLDWRISHLEHAAKRNWEDFWI